MNVSLSSLRCRVYTYVLICAGFLTVIGSAHAQASVAGSIEGRVQNLVTGRYLNNARVSIKQTDLRAFTDEFGNFRLANVPAGPVTLEVFYTGLDSQEIALTVTPGQVVQRDVDLTNTSLYGDRNALIKLDPMVVASMRETDQSQIAINEQRFAPNIKNVVSTDAHGEVMGGNLGEFLKYVPGLDGGVGGFEPEGIVIRGFPSNLARVTGDGGPLANSGGNRSFTLEQVTINNLSRVEVTKVPTPANPADGMAGSVNLISKSSFERKGAEFRYNLNLTGNLSQFTLNKVLDLTEKKVHRVKPGFSFDYTLPVTRNFGIVVTGMHYNAFVAQNWSTTAFNAAGTSTGASFAAPYFQQHTLIDSPQFRVRNSGSIKADWRVAPNSVLSVGLNSAYYDQWSGNISFQANVGTNGTPSVAGGTPMTFGPTFTNGATGRGSIGQSSGGSTRFQMLSGGNVRYRFNDGNWSFDAMYTHSLGKSWTKAEKKFAAFTTTSKVPVRVSFSDLNAIGPGRVQVFTNTNQPFDIYDINNYNLTAASLPRRDLRDTMDAGLMNLKKTFATLPVPASLQVGWSTQRQQRELQNFTVNYNYLGVNGDRSATPFAAEIYRDAKLPLISSIERNNSGKGPPWASPFIGWDAFLKNPALFAPTPAQIAATERTRRNNSLYFKEQVDAFYLQGEVRLLNNRLNVLTGVRYEKTTTYGEGVLNDPNGVWARNADGSFARNAAGARIRKAEAGAAGSFEEINFTHTERGFNARRTYDGFYPSLHLTYNITENFLLRSAYARTYGRPNLNEIVPNTTINENDLGEEPDPSQVLGTISVRNTGLKPWQGDNYDVTLEYYTDAGGLFGASYFHKEVKDFFGTFSRVATATDLEALDLDPRYAGWQVNTRINAGDARVSGFELSANHSLQRFGSWGRHFNVFANTTRISTDGSNQTDFAGFLPKTINWGFTFSRKPLSVRLQWNHRGLNRTSAATAMGPDAFNYVAPRTQWDVNVDYRLRNQLSVFVNLRNALNSLLEFQRYGSATPDYAKRQQTRDYGAVVSAGIKGSF